jgi:peptidyl-dipeptidase Dcp
MTMHMTRFAGVVMLAASTTACAAGAPAVTADAAPQPQPTVPAAVSGNPLLAPWSGPYGGAPPFDRVRPELFPEAFQAGINARRVEIQSITNNPEPATFVNTFVPLQNSGRQLGRVLSVF